MGRKVYEKSHQVDPKNELDWYSLAIGFGIAWGLSPKDAHDFSRYLRFSTHLV